MNFILRAHGMSVSDSTPQSDPDAKAPVQDAAMHCTCTTNIPHSISVPIRGIRIAPTLPGALPHSEQRGQGNTGTGHGHQDKECQRPLRAWDTLHSTALPTCVGYQGAHADRLKASWPIERSWSSGWSNASMPLNLI